MRLDSHTPGGESPSVRSGLTQLPRARPPQQTRARPSCPHLLSCCSVRAAATPHGTLGAGMSPGPRPVEGQREDDRAEDREGPRTASGADGRRGHGAGPWGGACWGREGSAMASCPRTRGRTCWEAQGVWFPALRSGRGRRRQGTAAGAPTRRGGGAGQSGRPQTQRARGSGLGPRGGPPSGREGRGGPFPTAPATEHLPRTGARLGDRREAPTASAIQLCLASKQPCPARGPSAAGPPWGPARPGPAPSRGPRTPVPRVGDPLSPLLREEVASFQLEGKHRGERSPCAPRGPAPHPASNRRGGPCHAGAQGRKEEAARVPWLRWGGATVRTGQGETAERCAGQHAPRGCGGA